MVWIESNFSDALLRGATFTDPDGKLDGYILFYEGEIKDGTGGVAGKRLFGLYANEEEIRPISPAIIWDLAEGDGTRSDPVDLEALKQRAFKSVAAQLEQYREELLKERTRQAEIKRKYGIKSLEHLIVELDGDLISLYDRKFRGENVDLVIHNKEERKEEYERALHELEEQIDKESSLSISMPRFIGIIRVKPMDGVDETMRNDPEIERIGMKVASEYEIRNGRTPEDVSAENLGFDIRSKGPGGQVRYIEVKTRAGKGPVALTQNEWFKAQRFGDDFYLYAVMNAATKPQLYIVQNPAKSLKPEEKIEVVRYVVPFQEIVAKGEESE